MELASAMAALLFKFSLRLNFELEPQFSVSLNELHNFKIFGDVDGTSFHPASSDLLFIIRFARSGTRFSPTWEVTCFFGLHGAFTAIEVAVKKVVKGRFQLSWVVTGQITMAFVLVTFDWFLFRQLIRNGVDVKAISTRDSAYSKFCKV
ncbi:hypothetical protein Tco_1228402 [Tanacetum coccineum]